MRDANIVMNRSLLLRFSARRAESTPYRRARHGSPTMSARVCGHVRATHHHRRHRARCHASGASGASPQSHVLRDLLQSPKIIQAPCAHDALSARLIERAGFDAAFMSGFCVSASRLALPDTGLISYGEMV